MTMCKDAVRASYCLKETAPGVGSNGKKTTVTQDSGQHRTRLTWAFGHSIKRKRVVWFVGTEMRCQVWSCVKPRSRSMANPPWHSGTIAIRSQVLPKCFSNHAQDISGFFTTGCLVQHDWNRQLSSLCLGFAVTWTQFLLQKTRVNSAKGQKASIFDLKLAFSRLEVPRNTTTVSRSMEQDQTFTALLVM